MLVVPRMADSAAQDPSTETAAPTTASAKSPTPRSASGQLTKLVRPAARHLDTVMAGASLDLENAIPGRLVVLSLSQIMDSAATSTTRPARALVMETAVPDTETVVRRMRTAGVDARVALERAPEGDLNVA
ncbi:hypothetical protein F66182_7618 [Fusarium sp. NRRL 66182]|nr:hypothetical protein F66182_7618 [Fusarium sp. NRRL 66182]